MKQIEGCYECGWVEGYGEPHDTNCAGTVGPLNLTKPKLNRSTAVYITPSERKRLASLAGELGCFATGGRYIGLPSLSEMLRQIADGRLIVSRA